MKPVTLSRQAAGVARQRPTTVNIQSKKMRIGKILVPVDFFAPSHRAIDYALSLSKYFHARLDLVHVFEPVTTLVNLVSAPVILPDAEMKLRLQRQLHKLAKAHAVTISENLHLVQGRPFEQICRLAHKEKVDLIVIPTRGNTGLRHLALGSTAERVVRYSPCPVLALRSDKTGTEPSRPEFRKIVVPVDFSPCSMVALEYAGKLAREFGSTLVLLHSVYLQYYTANDEYSRYDFPELVNEAEKAAREQMADLIEKTDWDKIKVEVALESGHPGQQICDRAKDRQADLIVTATHGHTGFKHVLLGSTAEYVVRHAACPVMVVPTRKRAAWIETDSK